jgi:hypothetical protein
MKTRRNKYYRLGSSIILWAYITFLLTATFHAHEIHFYKDVRFHEPLKSLSSELESVCLFNQLNTSTYFYCNSDIFTFDATVKADFSTIALEIISTPKFIFYSYGLRAPPTFV